MSNDKALEVLNQIQKALEDYQTGYANSEAIRVIDGLLREVRNSAEAPANLVGEKLSSIRELVGIVFSSRKHQRYGGVESVKSSILRDLASLRIILSRRSNAEESQ